MLKNLIIKSNSGVLIRKPPLHFPGNGKCKVFSLMLLYKKRTTPRIRISDRHERIRHKARVLPVKWKRYSMSKFSLKWQANYQDHQLASAGGPGVIIHFSN